MELSERKRSEYLDLRHRYEPRSVKLGVIAESPPASGLYFYNPTGATSEWLFRALMQQLPFLPVNKESGLLESQRRGWILVARRTHLRPKFKRERRTAKKIND